MKVGDLVTIRDGSWARYVKDGELKCVGSSKIRGPHYKIVETNCLFPLANSQTRRFCNNAVVQAVKTCEVIFIHQDFLRPATHTITIDGEIIEITNEFYKALKKSLEE